MKIGTLELKKEQYIVMGVSLFLYILMLTKLFFTLNIDSLALIDLIIVSTVDKVEHAISFLPSSHFSSYYIQLLIDSLFVSMFYPLLISLFPSSFLLTTLISLSGTADMIENGILFYFLGQRAPQSLALYIASSATNIKFSLLALSVIIIVIKILRKKS